MSQCKGCEDTHERITDLEARIKTLEVFRKWAEPILKSIQILVNDEKWKRWIITAFVGIVTYVYIYQIYPSFEKVNDARIEVINIVKQVEINSLKGMSEFKTDILEMLRNNEKKINDHSTDTSKKSVSSLRSTLYNQRDDLKAAISEKPNFNINQRVGD